MTATTTTRRRAYNGPSPEEAMALDLIALMEQGTAPWRKPWTGNYGAHRNLITGAEYQGANPLLLQMGMITRATDLPLWVGAAQAKSLGWFPKKGSKCVRIVRPQLNKREEENSAGEAEIRAWVSYKVVPVFNARDLCGATDERESALQQRILESAEPLVLTPRQRLDSAEAVLENWCVKVEHGGHIAAYSPEQDKIFLPHPDAFTSREAMCATWAHEVIHSTGHSDRLARFGACMREDSVRFQPHLFGSPASVAYAREELIAELGAVLLCYRLQIGSNFEHHAAYLSYWCEMLKESPKILLKILSDARQAADLVAPETARDCKEQG